jgi:hypothetical protein
MRKPVLQGSESRPATQYFLFDNAMGINLPKLVLQASRGGRRLTLPSGNQIFFP